MMPPKSTAASPRLVASVSPGELMLLVLSSLLLVVVVPLSEQRPAKHADVASICSKGCRGCCSGPCVTRCRLDAAEQHQ